MKQITRDTLSLLCLLGALLAPGSGGAAPEKKEKTAIVSPQLYKQLQKADELISRAAYGEALAVLRKVLPELEQSSYEQAAVLRSLSSVYSLQGDYRQAASALEKSIATGTLPQQQEREARLNLGKLYVAAGDYQKAVAALEQWLRQAGSADADTHMLIANAYAQLKRYRQAIPHAEKAIQLSNKKPEEWYKMLLAMHYESGNFRACTDVLKTLMRRSPGNKEYWKQLASLYQQLGQHSKALAVQRLAYRSGLLGSPREIRDLINLHLYAKAPHQASRLLQQEIERGRLKASAENYELLADAWSMAREYQHAIAALKKASALKDDGELYLRLGRLYLEQENWNAAQAALNNAIAKGGLKRPGEAYLLLGMSYHELDRKDSARQAFLKAQNYGTTRNSARQWLNYIAAEKS